MLHIYSIYLYIKNIILVLMYSPQQTRRNRLNNIRASLQQIPVFRQTTITLTHKLQKRKKRKESLQLQDENITESQINEIIQKDQLVKGMGKFLQKYSIGQKVGEGMNGFVKKCYLRTTNQLFAVKTINTDVEHIQFLKKNFKYIKALNHPNIIRYHLMYLDSKKNTCHLVMDYDDNPSLEKFYDLPEHEVKQIIYQLINTLVYIHSQNICHRDIKPDNILYDHTNKKIKIIDFGISKKIIERDTKKDMLTITGTLYYRAPEMFLGGGYNQKVDMWAVGVTLYQLLNKGKTPFQSQYLSNTIENITRGQVQFPQQIWKNYSKFAKDLVIRLLKKSSERLSAAEAKKHLWFNESEFLETTDITKSAALYPKIIKGLKKKVSSSSQEQMPFERSLTMVKAESMMVEGKDETKNHKNQIKLKKWLDESEDEDVLLDIDSAEQNQHEQIKIA